MVHLVLSSTKGNQGLRYFPYTGYLGLTPIRVDGVVRTKLDADLKLLHAKSLTISIRCYESRIGRVNIQQSNCLVDYTQVLWSKPEGSDYEAIGNLEFPFRISVPAKVAGFSTAVFVDYRCMWRIEAVLSHIPIAGVGSRQVRHFELPLVRYDIPPFASMTPSPEPLLSHEINKPRTPRIRYSIHSPKSPIGPLDLVSIPIHLQPLEPGVSIRSASVIVERRITLRDVPPQSSHSSPNTPMLHPSTSSSSLNKSFPLKKSPSHPQLQLSSLSSSSSNPPSSYNSQYAYQEPEPEASTSDLSISSSNPTITPGTMYPSSLSISSETPLLPPSSSNSSNIQTTQNSSLKNIVNPIAGVESSGRFSHDGNGTWTKTLTLQWPAAKSHSRWAIGETISSELVTVKYFIRAKIIVTSATGTETVELADKELLVVSTNEAERQLALSKYNEMHDAMVVDGYSRSKSKSPRRSRPEREDAIPPSPAVNSTNHAVSPSYNRSKSSSRRPHTSAGPRDKPVNFAGGAYGRPRGQEGETFGQTSLAAGNGSSDPSTKRRSELVVSRTLRPDSSHKRSGAGGGGGVGFLSGNGSGKVSSNSFWSTVHSNGVAPRMKGAPSGSSTSTTASSSSVSSSSHGDSEASDHMREWEEELAKIEVKSRRSSDLLGFSGKRKRSAGAPRVIVPS